MPRIISRIIDQYDFEGPPVSGNALVYDSSTQKFKTSSSSGNGIQTITSNNGSIAVASSGTNVDLSVTIAGSTNNVVVQVKNLTGSLLTKGTVVYINAATGQLPNVTKALATSDATSAQTLGMLSADLANGGTGYVTIIGLIDDIDTSLYQDGDQLYLSGTTAGTFTNTKTYAPIHLVYVGVVQYAHQIHGKIFVKVQNGYELDELHNVIAQYPTSGQTIVYNSASGLWLTAQLPLDAGVTGILPIANGGTNNSTLGTSGAVLYFDGSQVQGQSLLSYTSSGIGINSSTPSGALQLNTLSSSGKGLIVKASSGQTSNIQEWQNSAGTALASVNATGTFTIGTTGTNQRLIVQGGTNAQNSEAAFVVKNQAGSNVLFVDTKRPEVAIGSALYFGQGGATSSYFSLNSQYAFSWVGNVTTAPDSDSVFYITNGSNITKSTGTTNNISALVIGPTFAPTTGTISYSSIKTVSTINQTSAASGTVRGLWVNDTITSVLGEYRAIETARGNVVINAGVASSKGVSIIGASGQTANLQEWSSSSGTALSYIDATGKLYNNNLLALPTSSGAGNNINIIAGSGVSSGAGGSVILQAGVQATTGGDGKIVIRQASGQTSNLQEWQTPSGTLKASIKNNGAFLFPTTNSMVYNVAQLNQYGTYGGIIFEDIASDGRTRMRQSTTTNSTIDFWHSNSAIQFNGCAGNNMFLGGSTWLGTTGGWGGSQATRVNSDQATPQGRIYFYGQTYSSSTNHPILTNSYNGYEFYTAVNASWTGGQTGYPYGYKTLSASGHTWKFTPASGSVNPLCVQSVSGQTANLQEWQNASGKALSYIDSTGALSVNNIYSIPTASGAGNNVNIIAGSGVSSGAGGSIILKAGVQAASGGDGSVIIRQSSGQAETTLFRIQSSASADLYRFDYSSAGNKVFSIGTATTLGSNGTLQVGLGTVGGTQASTVIGITASSAGANGTAIGFNANNSGGGFAGGMNATAGAAGVAIGYASSSNQGVAIGNAATNSYAYGVAIGNTANSGGQMGVAVGGLCSLTYDSVGVGVGSNTSTNAGYGSIALGHYAIATGRNQFVIKASPRANYSLVSYQDIVWQLPITDNTTDTYLTSKARHEWSDFNVATRTGRSVFSTFYITTEQEGFRIQSYSDQARVAFGGVASSGTRIMAYAGLATEKILTLQAASGQTANLQEWQNSSSGVLHSIDASGGVNLYPYGTSAGNTNSIKFLELAANGSNFVGFKAADSIASNVTWILPSGDGTTGQALVTNGSGTLSWATAGGGGGTGTVTSVSGTGSVNGLTLTGTVTNSGSLTLGGTLSNVSLTTAVSGILPIANGGTNLSSIGSANQILGVNSGASALEYKTLTAGSGISISNTAGAITVNSSGLTNNALTIGNGLTGGSFNGSSATTINVNSSGYSNTTTGTVASYDLGTTSFVKANPSTSGLTINGFSSSGSYDGRNVKLVNVSNYNITIVNTGTTVCVGGTNIILGSKDAAELILDSGASVWRVF